MKVTSMNVDQYKISIEAHPLEMLYTKYSTNETSQCQSVRPLGRIRQEIRPCSEYHNTGRPQVIGTGDKANVNTEMNLNTRGQSGRARYRCDQNTSLDSRDKEIGNFPTLKRSKTQAFENKFKIASSRSTGQDSPSPIFRPAKHTGKKVVHLPLFKINLRTYCAEEDVSRTVAKTRESLRKLMELNKAKMKHANVITANIKNYEFNAPKANTSSIREGNSDSPRTLVSQPFHAKPALKSSRDREPKTKSSINFSKTFNFRKGGAVETDVCADNEVEETREKSFLTKRQISDFIEAEDEPDCSLLSLAMRPDTSLTLGTTMHQIDRVFKSPTSEELRELSEAFKTSDTSPAWPSMDDIQALIARSQSRTTKSRTPFSRPNTVQNHVAKIPDVDPTQKNYRKQLYLHHSPYEHGNKPVIRYTSKQACYKLDPIIVPSHTCTECPMCNIYQRDVETPCPPNTPNTSQFMSESELRPVFVRGTKINGMHSNHDVLRISRINMNGYVSPQDDPSVMSFMKAV